MIRKATPEDLSRIAEILVFVKRIKFRPIFQDDDYSFGELQVLPVAKQYSELLDRIWVYDDNGIVKGLIHIEGKEIKELYVDYFFQSMGIGSRLIEYATRNGGRSRQMLDSFIAHTKPRFTQEEIDYYFHDLR